MSKVIDILVKGLVAKGYDTTDAEHVASAMVRARAERVQDKGRWGKSQFVEVFVK